MSTNVMLNPDTTKKSSFEKDYPSIKAYTKQCIYTAKIGDQVTPDEVITDVYLQLSASPYDKRTFLNKVSVTTRFWSRVNSVRKTDSLDAPKSRRGRRSSRTSDDAKRCGFCKDEFPLSDFYLNPHTGVYSPYCPDCRYRYQKAYNNLRYVRERHEYSDRIVINYLLGTKKYKGGDFDFAWFKFHPEIVEQHKQKLIRWDEKRRHITGTSTKERSRSRRKYDKENLTDRYVTQCIISTYWAKWVGIKMRDVKYIPGLIEYWRGRILWRMANPKLQAKHKGKNKTQAIPFPLLANTNSLTA